MSSVRLPRVGRLRVSSTVGRSLLLLAATVLGSCSLSTDPNVPDIIFYGTIPAHGSIIYHQFVAPQNGELSASIVWANAQTHQTVCVARSDFAELTPVCGTEVAGTSNAVHTAALTGNPFLIYGSPDLSTDATYTIEVRVRPLKD